MEMHPENRITTTQCLKHRWMELQCTDLEGDLARLNLEHSSSPGFVRSDIIPNHSASWTNLSNHESETAKTTVQRIPANSLNSYQEGSKRISLEQLYGKPPIQQNLRTTKELVTL